MNSVIGQDWSYCPAYSANFGHYWLTFFAVAGDITNAVNNADGMGQ